jgi:hypothetical protein
MHSFDKAVEYELGVARSALSGSVGLAVPFSAFIIRHWKALTDSRLGFWCLPPPYDDTGSEIHSGEDSPAAFRFWKSSYNQAVLEEWVEQFGVLQGNDALLVDAELKIDFLRSAFAEAFQDPSHFAERTRVWRVVERTLSIGSPAWVGVPTGTDSECLCLIVQAAHKGLLTNLSEFCSSDNLPFAWIAS